MEDGRTSAMSIQESTRQHLQNPSSRHVYAVDNGFDTAKFDSTNNFEVAKDQNERDISLHPLQQLKKHLTEVRVRCIFLRLGEIDTLNERYYAEVLLEASWETSAFKDTQTRSFDPSIHWTPKLELMNGIGQLQDDISYSIHFDKQSIATVTEHHKLKGTLWERMELKHFPMDIQALSILITTSRSESEMSFVQNLRKPSGVNRRVFTDEQEWYLFEHVDIEITQQIDEYLDDGHNHPTVICSCHAARKYGYFMWNAYFLIFLITSASFTTFPIPLTNIQGRIQIACTLLLTSITFRSSCNKILPTISYLTALDVYAIGSIFSLCLLNIYHGVIGYVNFYVSTATTISVPQVSIIDQWALLVFTVLFSGYQIGTFIWVYFVPWKKRRMMEKKDIDNRLHIAANCGDSKATFLDVLLKAKQTMKTHSH